MTPNFKLSTGSYAVGKFHSGEIQITLTKLPYKIETVSITGSMLSSDHIMELLQLVETLRHSGWGNLTLVMPYCAFSRQDRRCNPGESFSLKVFTNLINSCNFQSVTTYDNHSDVATALIDNCTNVSVKSIMGNDSNFKLFSRYDFFISPDAGANKKVFDCSNHFITSMIRADKSRDTQTGAITSTDVYATAEQLDNKTVLIVDDICAGGRTFIELAKSLKAIQPNVIIHLYVTHGFFTHHFSGLQEAGITKCVTTDSVFVNNIGTESAIGSNYLTVIKL